MFPLLSHWAASQTWHPVQEGIVHFLFEEWFSFLNPFKCKSDTRGKWPQGHLCSLNAELYISWSKILTHKTRLTPFPYAEEEFAFIYWFIHPPVASWMLGNLRCSHSYQISAFKLASRFHQCRSEPIKTCVYGRVIWPGSECRLYPFPLQTNAWCWCWLGFWTSGKGALIT